MTEPTVDRYGNLAYRWVSGGVQITGTLYVDHALRCCDAWRAKQVERLHKKEAEVIGGPYVKRLPFRIEKVS